MVNKEMTATQFDELNENQRLLFPSRKGDIPFFDHPLMIGHKVNPKNYYPLVTQSEVLRDLRNGMIDEEDIQFIKMIGDSIAIHEDQLRRVMEKAGYSASYTSKKLNKLRRNGYITRWKCRLEHDVEEKIKPPAPFTLGVAGYILLTEFYPQQRFTRPESWNRYAEATLQRYVSLNELRTSFAELRILRDWKWNVGVDYNRHIPVVSAVSKLETPKGYVHFLIERQNFVGYLTSKLRKWQQSYEQHGEFKLNRLEDIKVPVVVIYCSTMAMAEHIQKEVMLDVYPFTIWVCVEEDYEEHGDFSRSFYQVKDEKLTPITVSFLKPEK